MDKNRVVPDIISEPCEGPFPEQSACCLDVTTCVLKWSSAKQEKSLKVNEFEFDLMLTDEQVAETSKVAGTVLYRRCDHSMIMPEHNSLLITLLVYSKNCFICIE